MRPSQLNIENKYLNHHSEAVDFAKSIAALADTRNIPFEQAAMVYQAYLAFSYNSMQDDINAALAQELLAINTNLNKISAQIAAK